MTVSEDVVVMDDGVPLFVRSYQSESAVERTLFIVHGVCEHGGRYEHVAEAAVARGWKVVLPDLRGHGKSGGVSVHVTTFERYLTDIDRLIEHFHLVPRKTALLGHSMGGLVSARYVQTRDWKCAALVAVAPWIGLSMSINPIVYGLGRLLAGCFPRVRFRTNIRRTHLTHDAELSEKREGDPLIHRSVTAGWFIAGQQAVHAAKFEAAKITVPMLVLQGDIDPIVDARATQVWFSRLGSADKDKELQILPNHLHEILNEPDRNETLSRIFDWLQSRVSDQQI